VLQLEQNNIAHYSKHKPSESKNTHSASVSLMNATESAPPLARSESHDSCAVGERSTSSYESLDSSDACRINEASPRTKKHRNADQRGALVETLTVSQKALKCMQKQKLRDAKKCVKIGALERDFQSKCTSSSNIVKTQSPAKSDDAQAQNTNNGENESFDDESFGQMECISDAAGNDDSLMSNTIISESFETLPRLNSRKSLEF